jgi:hypothetical protein
MFAVAVLPAVVLDDTFRVNAGRARGASWTIWVSQRGLEVVPERVRDARSGAYHPAEPDHRRDGQQLRGMTMGLSMALHEEGVTDLGLGCIVNGDLAGYHIASHADAQHATGIRIRELPVTPDKLLG